jgi:hypothetical protein
MRDIREVLNEKEIQLSAVRREVEALRLVASLLAEESDGVKKPPQSADQLVLKDGTTGQPVKRLWPLSL